MKFLFADIDGCLNDHDFDNARMSTTIHRDKVDRLNRVLLITDARIVLSSAWRYIIHRGEMQLQGMEWLLRSHGLLADRLYSVTRPDTMMPTTFRNGERDTWPVENERGRQIADWLHFHRGHNVAIESYAVMDDLDLGITDCGHPFVHVNGKVGLTDADAGQIIRLLNGDKA